MRRLRIYTKRADVARSLSAVYHGVNSEQLARLLAAHAAETLLKAGLAEARLIVQEWLVTLAAAYNEYLASARDGRAQQLDTAFRGIEQLQFIPRFVFSMLKSDLLTLAPLSADRRAVAVASCLSLPTSGVLRVLYPPLASFRSYARMGMPILYLSSAVVDDIPDPALVLETPRHIIVLLKSATVNPLRDADERPPAPLPAAGTPGAAAAAAAASAAAALEQNPMPFPPPARCPLRDHVQRLRGSACPVRVSPQVIYTTCAPEVLVKLGVSDDLGGHRPASGAAAAAATGGITSAVDSAAAGIDSFARAGLQKDALSERLLSDPAALARERERKLGLELFADAMIEDSRVQGQGYDWFSQAIRDEVVRVMASKQ